MEFCRVCLSGAPEKHMSQLKASKKDDKTYSEIFSFCLDIKIQENCKQTTKLCTKCFKKILTFYKFKSMALKNDTYLNTIIPEPQLTLKVEPLEEPEVFAESVTGIDLLSDVKDEILDEEYLEDVRIQDNYKASDVQNELGEVANCHPKNTEDTPHKTIARKKKNRLQINKANSKISNKNQVKSKRPKNPVKGNGNKDNGPGICDQCGAYVKNLYNHSLIHVPKEKRQLFPCTECDKVFLTRGALGVHRNRKHLGKLEHCALCNKDFAFLKSHVMLMHQPDKLPLECGVCKARFRYMSNLNKHKTLHTKEKAHQCDQCGKHFRLKVILGYHIRSVHQKEKNFVCQHCPKSFFKKYHYMNHLRTHTKERPYKCKACTKSFGSSTALKAHHRSNHSSNKEFHCTLCDKSFAVSSTLYMHLRAHRKLKPYCCRHCGVGYARTFDRKKHERKHHPDNNAK